MVAAAAMPGSAMPGGHALQCLATCCEKIGCTSSMRALCLHAGLRQVRPGGRHFPSWFDIYPNSENVQKVEAPVCVLHVRPLAFTSTLMTLPRYVKGQWCLALTKNH